MTRSHRSRRPQRTTRRSQQVTIGGITGVILILVALFAQFVLGIDVLNTGEEATPAASPVPTAIANVPDGSGTTLTPINGGYDGGWFQLYFTTPLNTTDESRFTGSPLEAALVALIDSATQTVDAALFELNSQPVTDALIRASKRPGVTVRVVTDGEHGLEQPDTTMDQIEMAGIKVVSDGTRGGFMHNKFVVVDGTYVWTGSTNITHNDIYNNNNNAMLIRSSRLAENFTAEFNELFGKKFGRTSPADVPNPTLTVEGTQIETYFEAEGDAPTRLLELINGAHSVRFMAFSLTREDMIGAMRTRAEAGQLDLMGIVEASQRSFAKDLFCAGLPVRQDGNSDILHHKVFIIDESIVVMGSFNFSSKAANENDENMLIIHNPAIAQAYLEEFTRRWAEAKTVPGSELGC